LAADGQFRTVCAREAEVIITKQNERSCAAILRALTAKGRKRTSAKIAKDPKIAAQAELERGSLKGCEEGCNSARRARFAKNDNKIPAAEAETLFDFPGHGYARVVTRHIMAISPHPEAASAVVEFEGTCV
jgi:hypothetical protein